MIYRELARRTSISLLCQILLNWCFLSNYPELTTRLSKWVCNFAFASSPSIIDFQHQESLSVFKAKPVTRSALQPNTRKIKRLIANMDNVKHPLSSDCGYRTCKSLCEGTTCKVQQTQGLCKKRGSMWRCRLMGARGCAPSQVQRSNSRCHGPLAAMHGELTC